MATDRKLKILCLHGYRQDGEQFKEKLGAFRKAVKNVAELVFMDAPHIIPKDETNNEAEAKCPRPGRGWWFSKQNNTFNPLEISNVSIGLEESKDVVEEAFKEKGPFDGILGFSQGAAMVAMLCVMKEQGEFPYSFNFAFMIAAFKSKCICHQALYEQSVTMPSLHVIGKTDQVIPKDMSEELLQIFKDPKTVYHNGGHFIPTSSEFKAQYLEFFSQMS